MCVRAQEHGFWFGRIKDVLGDEGFKIAWYELNNSVPRDMRELQVSCPFFRSFSLNQFVEEHIVDISSVEGLVNMIPAKIIWPDSKSELYYANPSDFSLSVTHFRDSYN